MEKKKKILTSSKASVINTKASVSKYLQNYFGVWSEKVNFEFRH